MKEDDIQYLDQLEKLVLHIMSAEALKSKGTWLTGTTNTGHFGVFHSQTQSEQKIISAEVVCLVAAPEIVCLIAAPESVTLQDRHNAEFIVTSANHAMSGWGLTLQLIATVRVYQRSLERAKTGFTKDALELSQTVLLETLMAHWPKEQVHSWKAPGSIVGQPNKSTFSVTVAGPERYNGEQPYTYVVTAEDAKTAVDFVLKTHRVQEGTDDVILVDVKSGLPDGTFVWNDLRSFAPPDSIEPPPAAAEPASAP